MLSNDFAFRLCNLHNLAFRGLDLAYMPGPPGFANRDRPHACATRAAFRPPARLLHVQVPPSFAAKLCHRGSGRGEVQGVHDGWGPNDALRGPRRGDDGWARNAAIRRHATREKLPATKKIARQVKNLPGKKCGPKIPSNTKWKCKTVGDHAFLSLPFLFETLQTPSNPKYSYIYGRKFFLRLHSWWSFALVKP